MAGRWTPRADRPASHGEDCVCPSCWTRLETVDGITTYPAPWASWCGQHGDTVGDCDPCGPPWTPDGAA